MPYLWRSIPPNSISIYFFTLNSKYFSLSAYTVKHMTLLFFVNLYHIRIVCFRTILGDSTFAFVLTTTTTTMRPRAILRGEEYVANDASVECLFGLFCPWRKRLNRVRWSNQAFSDPYIMLTNVSLCRLCRRRDSHILYSNDIYIIYVWCIWTFNMNCVPMHQCPTDGSDDAFWIDRPVSLVGR